MDSDINDTSPAAAGDEKEVVYWEKPPKPFWGLWGTIGFGLIVFIITSVAQAIASFVYVLPTIQANPPADTDKLSEMLMTDSVFLTISGAIGLVFMTGFVLVFMKIRSSTTLGEYLSLKKLSVRVILLLLAVTLVLTLLNDLVFWAFKLPFEGEFMYKAYASSPWPPLLWIATIIFAPVSEEVFFRGFVYQGLAQSRLGFWGAIIIAAALWALMHMQYGIATIVAIFITGVFFGLARYRTGSLWAPLLMHACWNLLAMVYIALDISNLFG